MLSSNSPSLPSHHFLPCLSVLILQGNTSPGTCLTPIFTSDSRNQVPGTHGSFDSALKTFTSSKQAILTFHTKEDPACSASISNGLLCQFHRFLSVWSGNRTQASLWEDHDIDSVLLAFQSYQAAPPHHADIPLTVPWSPGFWFGSAHMAICTCSVLGFAKHWNLLVCMPVYSQWRLSVPNLWRSSLHLHMISPVRLCLQYVLPVLHWAGIQ